MNRRDFISSLLTTASILAIPKMPDNSDYVIGIDPANSPDITAVQDLRISEPGTVWVVITLFIHGTGLTHTASGYLPSFDKALEYLGEFVDTPRHHSGAYDGEEWSIIKLTNPEIIARKQYWPIGPGCEQVLSGTFEKTDILINQKHLNFSFYGIHGEVS